MSSTTKFEAAVTNATELQGKIEPRICVDGECKSSAYPTAPDRLLTPPLEHKQW